MAAIDLFVTTVYITAFVLLSWTSLRVLRNVRFLRWVQYLADLEQVQPRVSVLVPARNEEAGIVECIESLAQQSYPDFEILVLDDQSTDNTLDLVRTMANRYTTIKVLQGRRDPPSGWNGKSFACYRLAAQATGEWLLFTDADTRHMLQSITQGIGYAVQLDVDLLSVMPRQITKSWAERLMVPFIIEFLPLLGVDLGCMWRRQGSVAIANGQYLLVRRSAYQEMGGHAAIASALVDDFALADHFLRNDRRIALVNGTTMLACRMYHNASEVWQGFSKNILLSLQMSRSWPLWSIIVFAWSFVSLFVLPTVILVTYPEKFLAMIAIGWLILLRMIVGFVTHRSLAEAIATPLSAVGVMALGMNALMLKLRQQPIAWKERSYPVN